MLKNEAQEQAIHNIYGQTIIIACPEVEKQRRCLDVLII